MKIKAIITLCLAAFLSPVLTGCVAVVVAGAAVGTYAYVKGELKVNRDASLNRTWNASQAALKDLKFTTTTQKKDALSGWLVAKTASDKKVEINLKKVTDATTEIRIRVGTIGDEDLSKLILQKIDQHL